MTAVGLPLCVPVTLRRQFSPNQVGPNLDQTAGYALRQQSRPMRRGQHTSGKSRHTEALHDAKQANQGRELYERRGKIGTGDSTTSSAAQWAFRCTTRVSGTTQFLAVYASPAEARCLPFHISCPAENAHRCGDLRALGSRTRRMPRSLELTSDRRGADTSKHSLSLRRACSMTRKKLALKSVKRGR